MGLFRRQKVWWVSIQHEGRQVRRSTGTTDKRLATAILAKLSVKLIEGRYFDQAEDRDRTFGEMMDRYRTERAPLKAPQSRIRDETSLKHLRPLFGEKCLVGITPKHLAAYKAARRVEGAAPATINKELQLVRHAFNVAMREWEWCRENPMHRVSLEPVHNQVDRWLTAEEEKRLFAAAATWLREIIVVALHTGLRQGEMLALRWQDVDFTRRTLIVMKSKNKERRTLPLNNTVCQVLLSRRARHVPTSDVVFTTSSGMPLRARNLKRAFARAVTRAEIDKFRFHDLRHTFATRLVQQGIDLYKVQRLLGHKTGVMTQRYAHHCPESLREGVDRLEQRHSGITISSHLVEKQAEGPVGGIGTA